MNNGTVIRIARPTDNLQEIAKMYQRGLELDILGNFEDHDGFDGIILGHKGITHHFEFTSKRNHRVGKSPNDDTLIALYIPDREEWEDRCGKMLAAGFLQVNSFNPYWDISGRTFQDIDGYRVVLQNSNWE